MSNFLRFLLLFILMFITGCAVKSQSESKSTIPGQGLTGSDVEAIRSGLINSESLWVIVDSPAEKAGLYRQLEELPVSSVNAEVKIVEFLALVDLKIAYSQLEAGQQYQFKYPSANGLVIRTFQVQIGDKKFRAVIAAKKDAEKIYKYALKQDKNAHLIQQKQFSDLLVDFSVKQKSDVLFNFNYSQLLSLEKGKRSFSLPAFYKSEKAGCSLSISGIFSSELSNVEGLDKKLNGQKTFSFKLNESKYLQEGLTFTFSLAKEMKILTSEAFHEKAIKWDEDSKDYIVVDQFKKEDTVKVENEFIDPVFNFLEFRKMVREKMKYEELLQKAVNTKLLTPLTGLLLIDALL